MSNNTFIFYIYARDGKTILASTECPTCCYDTNTLQWTEVGQVYKRHTMYKARQTKHMEYDDYNISKSNSYFAKQILEQERRKHEKATKLSN